MKQPRKAPGDEDRQIELQEELDDTVSDILAEANDAGYGTTETLDALEEVVLNQRIIYDEDPDPADEPANDPK